MDVLMTIDITGTLSHKFNELLDLTHTLKYNHTWLRNSISTSLGTMRPSDTARINPSFPRNCTTPLTSCSNDGIFDGSDIGIPSEILKCIPMQIPASFPFFAADSADLPFT